MMNPKMLSSKAIWMGCAAVIASAGIAHAAQKPAKLEKHARPAKDAKPARQAKASAGGRKLAGISGLPDDVVSGACSEDLRQIFAQWELSGAFLPLGESYFAPAFSGANWIQYTKLEGQGDQLVLHRGSGEGLVVFVSSSGCTRQAAPVDADPAPWAFAGVGAVLDDSALAEMAARKETAIFFSISPHMYVSGLSWKVANAAAQRLNVKLIGVLDPFADAASLPQMSATYGVDVATLRPLASNVLKAGGLNLHYPSYLYMKNGKLLPHRDASARETEANYVALFRRAMQSSR